MNTAELPDLKLSVMYLFALENSCPPSQSLGAGVGIQLLGGGEQHPLNLPEQMLDMLDPVEVLQL